MNVLNFKSLCVHTFKFVMGSYGPLTALERAHEISVSEDGRSEVKYPFAFKNLDWDEYHRFRPQYPDSMFKTWLDYHREHSGRFQTAHDIGAGPGTVAARLASSFDGVVVSDAGRANIQSARTHLGSNAPHKFSFLHSPAESVHASVPPASTDFACVAMAFHYFDAPVAIRSIAETLRPGGTLAAVTYGFRLRFPDHPAMEKLWYAAASNESLRLIREGRLFPAAVRGLAAAMAGLDFVPLPLDWFEPGAVRMLINTNDDIVEKSQPLCFVDEDQSCWEPAPSRSRPTDVKKVISDKNWRREADVAWLRGFLGSSQMGFDQQTWETAEWRQLEQMVRAEGGQVTVEWPVAMILATRNNQPVAT